MTIIDSDELYEFYALLGQAVHSAQSLEGTLHKVLAVEIHFKSNPPTPNEAAEILEKFRGMTLGRLISTAIKNQLFSKNIITLLQSFNEDRRYVIHRLQEDMSAGFRVDVDLRQKISKKLEAIADNGFEINSRIVDEFLRTQTPEIFTSDRFNQELKKNLAEGGFL